MASQVENKPIQVEYKFFEAVEKSFDKAAAHTSWDPGILEQIKQCNAVYRMFFPVNFDLVSDLNGEEHVVHRITLFDLLQNAGVPAGVSCRFVKTLFYGFKKFVFHLDWFVFHLACHNRYLLKFFSNLLIFLSIRIPYRINPSNIVTNTAITT